MPKLSLRARALGLLARREHSAHELREKLAPHAVDKKELMELLEDLAQHGWLSEQRFTEQLIDARKAKYGTQRIVLELQKKGVRPDVIEEVLPQLKGCELATARAVWAKKYAHLPADGKERAVQMRYLRARGFGYPVIDQVLKGEDK